MEDRVLAVIQKYSMGNGVAFPGYRTIAKEAKMSLRDVGKAVSDLEECGWVVLARKKMNTGRMGTVYFVLSELPEEVAAALKELRVKLGVILDLASSVVTEVTNRFFNSSLKLIKNKLKSIEQDLSLSYVTTEDRNELTQLGLWEELVSSVSKLSKFPPTLVKGLVDLFLKYRHLGKEVLSRLFSITKQRSQWWVSYLKKCLENFKMPKVQNQKKKIDPVVPSQQQAKPKEENMCPLQRMSYNMNFFKLGNIYTKDGQDFLVLSFPNKGRMSVRNLKTNQEEVLNLMYIRKNEYYWSCTYGEWMSLNRLMGA